VVRVSKIYVIPCYNEEQRLDHDQVTALLSDPELHILFVDDGSKDQTKFILDKLASKNPRVQVLALARNQGKAEAVRLGLSWALKKDHIWVGYADADFATPAGELLRLMQDASRGAEPYVLASRVRLLGSSIERRPLRHYLGRIFATMASLVLDMPVYDTQCGAKVFRAREGLDQALHAPFTSRLAFDVELISRLKALRGAQAFREVPLRHWRDVGGSKLTLSALLKAGCDLIRIGWQLRRP
jgi:dolichyl-phosphate beta-glucosyltransferase